MWREPSLVAIIVLCLNWPTAMIKVHNWEHLCISEWIDEFVHCGYAVSGSFYHRVSLPIVANKSQLFMFLRPNSTCAAHFVLASSVTFIPHISSTLNFTNFSCFWFCSISSSKHGFSCPGVNYFPCLEIMICLKWPPHIVSSSSINFRNLSRY